MANSNIEQTPLDSHQHGQAQNIIDETASTYGTARPDTDVGAKGEAQGKAVRDQVDEAVADGPKNKKVEALRPGTVQVASTGDLHDLAAKRQP